MKRINIYIILLILYTVFGFAVWEVWSQWHKPNPTWAIDWVNTDGMQESECCALAVKPISSQITQNPTHDSFYIHFYPQKTDSKIKFYLEFINFSDTPLLMAPDFYSDIIRYKIFEANGNILKERVAQFPTVYSWEHYILAPKTGLKVELFSPFTLYYPLKRSVYCVEPTVTIEVNNATFLEYKLPPYWFYPDSKMIKKQHDNMFVYEEVENVT